MQNIYVHINAWAGNDTDAPGHKITTREGS